MFTGTAVTSSIGISNYFEDNTPPVTTCTLDPPRPDGLNGWYVSNITVILNATDDDSGVNTTYYHVDGGIWQTYIEPFILVDDGENILIEYYSIDNAGNQEDVKSTNIDIDQTKPEMCFTYEYGGDSEHGWEFTFTVTATDNTSGMERVEFYFNEVLQETVTGPGPTYVWVISWGFPLYYLGVKGLILNSEISEEYVKIFAIFVIVLKYGPFIPNVCAYAYDTAGNWDYDCAGDPNSTDSISPGIYLFKNLTFPNDYGGYIGKFLIRAKFYL